MATILKFTLTLLILLNFISLTLSSSNSVDREDEDLQDLEQLLAVDEDSENQNHFPQINLSEADHLRKSQRTVVELSNDKTNAVISKNQYVLVLGYAPWCGRSAELMPQFAEAASVLKEMGSGLVMAKIDGERYSQAASGIGIKGFPTLLFFVNGSSQVYTGGFTAKEIVVWARKKTGVPVIRVNSVAEAEEFLAKHQIYVIGLFEKFEGSKYEEFAKAAIADNEIQFAETSNTEVAKLLFPGLETSGLFLGLVKDEEEKYVTFEDTFQEDNILNFLEYNKFPLVTVMTELNSVRVHSGPVKLQVMVFAEDKEFKNLRATLQNVAKKFKSKIMFLYVNIAEENLAKPFLSLFGLEESVKTVVTGFDNKNSAKYLLEKDLTPDNLEEFCSGLLHGTLSQYFKSQPIPDNKEESVLIVVGKTFDELVLHSPQNILLEVHTPWCINCEATSKQVEKLAKHFKGLDNLIISRIDASLNEHPKLQVDDFPTLLFYPSGDKSNPIKLSSKSRLKDLAAFIKKNVKVDDQSVKEEL